MSKCILLCLVNDCFCPVIAVSKQVRENEDTNACYGCPNDNTYIVVPDTGEPVFDHYYTFGKEYSDDTRQYA